MDSRLWEFRDRLTLETHLSPTTKLHLLWGSFTVPEYPGGPWQGAGAAKCSGADSPLLLMQRGDEQAHLLSPACSIPNFSAGVLLGCAVSGHRSDTHSAPAHWKENPFLPSRSVQPSESCLLLLWECPDHSGPGLTCLEFSPEG